MDFSRVVKKRERRIVSEEQIKIEHPLMTDAREFNNVPYIENNLLRPDLWKTRLDSVDVIRLRDLVSRSPDIKSYLERRRTEIISLARLVPHDKFQLAKLVRTWAMIERLIGSNILSDSLLQSAISKFRKLRSEVKSDIGIKYSLIRSMVSQGTFDGDKYRIYSVDINEAKNRVKELEQEENITLLYIPELIDTDPKFIKIYEDVAKEYKDKGDIENADLHFRKAAIIARKIGDLNKALELFEQISNKSENDKFIIEQMKNDIRRRYNRDGSDIPGRPYSIVSKRSHSDRVLKTFPEYYDTDKPYSGDFFGEPVYNTDRFRLDGEHQDSKASRYYDYYTRLWEETVDKIHSLKRAKRYEESDSLIRTLIDSSRGYNSPMQELNLHLEISNPTNKERLRMFDLQIIIEHGTRINYSKKSN